MLVAIANVKDFSRFNFSGPTGFIVEIDGDGAILVFGFVGLWHVSFPSRR
jgi:hypothetical protein